MTFQSGKFPLKGGNELGHATVFGSTENLDQSAGQKLILVDMAMSNTKLPVEVFLVDYGNNYYRGELVWKGGAFPANFGYRQLYGFQLPKEADIKKISITPQGGEPFYIDWVPIPEASSNNLTIKFQRQDDTGYSAGWMVEVEAENNGSDKAELNKADFALEDQFGWEYALDSISPAGYYDEGSQIDLAPGEKADAVLEAKEVSPISRLVAIIYKPYGLRIDISNWT